MYYVGLDIGGTKCAATLGISRKNDMTIIKKDYFPTGDGEPFIVLEKFSKFIEEASSLYKIESIGISCGGPLDAENGIIKKPPSLRKWDEIKVTDYFESRFKIKTRLKNDADACAVAEWKYGAGKNCSNMVFLTFGTGFGAGLILNGKLYEGKNGGAGEIGHVRLTNKGPEGYYKHGSAEGYCSGSGIVRLADIMKNNAKLIKSYEEFYSFSVGEISAKTIAEYARKNNAFCKAVYKKSGEMLGKAVSILVDLLNVDKVVAGGIYMRATDLLYPHAIKVIEKESLPLNLKNFELLPAFLGENIGDYAALAVAEGNF